MDNIKTILNDIKNVVTDIKNDINDNINHSHHMIKQGRIQDSRRRGRQHTILPNFPKNYTKLRQFWCVGGEAGAGGTPLDPPLSKLVQNSCAKNASNSELTLCDNNP